MLSKFSFRIVRLLRRAKTSVIVSLVLVGLVGWPCRECVADPVRVGVPLPLTGDLQAYGREIQRGLEIAEEFFKPTGVQLVFEDDRCDAARSVSVAQKLVNVDHVQLITGIFCNTALFSAAPIFVRAHIPVLTLGATTGDKTGIGTNVFRLFPSDNLSVAPLLKNLTKSAHNLCVITETETYTALMERTLVREWKALGDDHQIAVESVNAGEKDFRAVLARLLRNRCDAMILNTAGDDGFIAAYRQIRGTHGELPLYAFYMPGSKAVREALGESLFGVTYADIVASDTLATSLGREFKELYQKKFGEPLVSMPVALFAFEGYRLILTAQRDKISLGELITRGPIKDGAITEYTFDQDGAVQGINFRVVRYDASGETVLN